MKRKLFMNIITPEQYIDFATYNYPVLYASTSYEQSKLKVLDHLFNVIGNGINETEFYTKPLTKLQTLETQKWYSVDKVWSGYKRVCITDLSFVFPDYSHLPIYAVEPNDCEEVKLWRESDVSYKFEPYPNFKKEYSLVWKYDMKTFGNEWIEIAIWFYEKCKEWFETEVKDNSNFYNQYDVDQYAKYQQKVISFCDKTIEHLKSLI